ncbi:MAG: ferrous iron transport protein A [Krumholzibacteria bacterium]|nr:ferrous iron transport protein A [Candidatus Krumholzibacteria bacterium]
MMTLSMVHEGARAVLRSIGGGQQMRGRLAALGLLPGTELEVVQNSGGGPFVVAVRGSRIVIGRGMAARIEVE